ncbi:hypothetical protein MLDJOKPK_00265 [Salmonella phage SPAsTU]|nr:hypothetical protein STsAS_151 [Salmonella phage STsAS]AWN09160.1 hypothetical protein MLDJOKPK_00265 [Salmonella phage SPAsTU]
MRKVIIEQHEMNYEELTKRYQARAPRVVEACKKYEEAEFVVFQLDHIPTMVFVKHVTDDHGNRLVMLYNVITTALEADIKLLRRYKDCYEQKAHIVAYDLPRTIMVDGCAPGILRFTRLEEDAAQPVHAMRPFTVTQDTFTQMGGLPWIDLTVPGLDEEQELHVVCYNPSIEHTISRHITEEHGFRNHRCVYIA